jgi:uncharacterized iron-regulated protein
MTGERRGAGPIHHALAAALSALAVAWPPGSSSAAEAQPVHHRACMWVDALRGEPVPLQDVLQDLRLARVIYIGEIHTIPRHHEAQQQVLEGLAAQGLSLVLAMEQFDFSAQPALDRYNTGVADLDGLIRETDLNKRWPGHTNYHALLASARAHSIPVLALNAGAETIRAVGRRGLAELPPEQRRELPEQLVTNDPVYERWLKKILGVHMAFDPDKLQPAFEAQVARDETMAARLVDFLNSPAGRQRAAVVICGRGHCEYGLGTPARVARRLPGVTQRIVLPSESGDLHLTEQERKQAREIEVSHEFLKELGHPPGDYLELIEPANPPQ